VNVDIFCDIEPCSQEANRRFGGTYRLHLLGGKSAEQETGVQQVARQGTVSQKMATFITKAVFFKSKLIYNRQTVGHSVFLLEISFRQLRLYYFVAPSLTRGRVFNLLCNCFWALPEQSLLD
jgi:hypothetical protein